MAAANTQGQQHQHPTVLVSVLCCNKPGGGLACAEPIAPARPGLASWRFGNGLKVANRAPLVNQAPIFVCEHLHRPGEASWDVGPDVVGLRVGQTWKGIAKLMGHTTFTAIGRMV